MGDLNFISRGLIPQEIIAKSGRAYIYFYSDLDVVASGFNISYRYCIKMHQPFFLCEDSIFELKTHCFFMSFRIIDNCPCINGRCNTAGLCVCNQDWTGSLCDVQKNCSCMNGVCNQTLGKCVCSDGFTGIEANNYYHATIFSNFFCV